MLNVTSQQGSFISYIAAVPENLQASWKDSTWRVFITLSVITHHLHNFPMVPILHVLSLYRPECSIYLQREEHKKRQLTPSKFLPDPKKLHQSFTPCQTPSQPITSWSSCSSTSGKRNIAQQYIQEALLATYEAVPDANTSSSRESRNDIKDVVSKWLHQVSTNHTIQDFIRQITNLHNQGIFLPPAASQWPLILGLACNV